jgi:hypothetical protein
MLWCAEYPFRTMVLVLTDASNSMAHHNEDLRKMHRICLNIRRGDSDRSVHPSSRLISNHNVVQRHELPHKTVQRREIPHTRLSRGKSRGTNYHTERCPEARTTIQKTVQRHKLPLTTLSRGTNYHTQRCPKAQTTTHNAVQRHELPHTRQL